MLCWGNEMHVTCTEVCCGGLLCVSFQANNNKYKAMTVTGMEYIYLQHKFTSKCRARQSCYGTFGNLE